MSTPDKTVGTEEHAHAPKNLALALVVICTAQLMVVLDATIVNIALPSIQKDLGFSQTNLQWVLTAYTLAFGGFLLLGGRAGDILGRRRVFIFGILLFTLGSLGGGFAWSEASLLVFRAVQGLGAAIAAPTALSLIATEFPEGKERNRAMGVYAAMSGAGAAVGLILGGILTESDWRWVMFVNVPIGLFIALVAPRALTETERHTGKFDLPGAITATSGLALLVYGLTGLRQTSARTPLQGSPTQRTRRGPTPPTSRSSAYLNRLARRLHLIEARSRHALMPLRIFENRNRAGAYGVMLIIGAAMFGMFFYLTQFVQVILGYSPIKAGFAFLPVSICIILSAGIASQLITRFGAKPFAMLGTAMTAIGMFWLAQIQPDSTYIGGLLGPMVVFALGLGFTFMPLTLAAVSQIDESDAGIASGVLNTTQQIGGSIGLAALTTVSSPCSPASSPTSSPAAGNRQRPNETCRPNGHRNGRRVDGRLPGLRRTGRVAFFITVFAIKVTKEEAAHAGPVGGAH